MNKKIDEYNSIELFAGAGGTATGLHKAGFTPLLLNEIDKDASATLKLNYPNWNVNNSDIYDLDCSEFLGKVDLVQGGVPCQAFSVSGLAQGFKDVKGRGILFWQFARIIEETHPKVIMMENVKGLLFNDKGRAITVMINKLNSLGYNVAVQVLKAQYYGVGQQRERLILIGVDRKYGGNIPILYPKPSNHITTLKEALKDCPKSEGSSYSEKKKKMFKHIPAGGNWRNLPDELLKQYVTEKTYNRLIKHHNSTGMLKRLAWNKPSFTIMCCPQERLTERCHPDFIRPLTVRESARVQSFDDDYNFVGSISSQYRQIGNAVPVKLAYHIGCALEQMLKIIYSEEAQTNKNTSSFVVDYDDRKYSEIPPVNIPDDICEAVLDDDKFENIKNTTNYKNYMKQLMKQSKQMFTK